MFLLDIPCSMLLVQRCYSSCCSLFNVATSLVTPCLLDTSTPFLVPYLFDIAILLVVPCLMLQLFMMFLTQRYSFCCSLLV
jgi:hypothetical protein